MSHPSSAFATFGQDYPGAMKKLKCCNILVIGRSGAGKTTLISQILDKDISNSITPDITSHRKWTTGKNLPLAFYDTPGLENNQKQQKQVKEKIANFLKERQQSTPQEQVHAIWYCIQANSERINILDKDWLNSLKTQAPITIILTRSLGGEDVDNFQEKVERAFPFCQVTQVLAKPEKTRAGLIPSYGFKTLKNKTEVKLDAVANKAIENSVNAMANAALWKVSRCSELAVFRLVPIPIPFLIPTIISGLQYSIIEQISQDFGYNFNSNFLDSIKNLSAFIIVGGLPINETIEQAVDNLPVNPDNVQEVLYSLANAIEQGADSSVSDFLINSLHQVSHSFVGNFLGHIPFLSVVQAATVTVTTVLLAIVYIETLKEYKKAEYSGQPQLDLQEMVSERLQEIMSQIQTALFTDVRQLGMA